ncbi:dystrophin-like [Arapaima gigas]
MLDMRESDAPDADPLCCLVIYKGKELRELSDGTRVFAVRRQEQLERGVLSAQEDENLLRLIQEQLLATDRHLSAYLNNQGGLTPVEEQRIRLELAKHELKLLEMSKRREGVEMTKRMRFQMDIAQKLLQEVSAKLWLLQRSDGLDSRLRECERVLGEVREKIPVFGMSSAEQEVLRSQLEQCMKCYRCLREMKVEVETVVKMGRQVAQNQRAKESAELHGRLTALKLLYNDLGAKVMTGKRDLESALALSQKLHAEAGSLTDWLAATDAELTRRSHLVSMPGDIDAEVAWSKQSVFQATEREAEQRKEQLAAVVATAEDLMALVPGQSSRVEDKVQLLRCNWKAVTSRNQERLRLLLVSVDGVRRFLSIAVRTVACGCSVSVCYLPLSFTQGCRTRMKALDLSCAHINAWMYKTEILLELERQASRGCCRDGSGDFVFQGLELELEDMRVKLVAVEDLGLALIRTQGEEYRNVVQPRLDTLSRQFEEISQRIHTSADLSAARRAVTPKPLRKTATLAKLPRWYQYERHDVDLLLWLDDIERNVAELRSSEAGQVPPLGPPARRALAPPRSSPHRRSSPASMFGMTWKHFAPSLLPSCRGNQTVWWGGTPTQMNAAALLA